MKSRLICLGLILSFLCSGAAYGIEPPVGVAWAEWNFTADFDAAGEIVAESASDTDSLIRLNPGTSAFSISDGVLTCTQTGPADYLRVDVDDVAANGGGGYVNEYTMIFDIKVDIADWVPIYNTGYDNYNAAELWVRGDGAVGSGAYTNPGLVPQWTWVRLVVTRKLEGANWYRYIYVDGTLVSNEFNSEGNDGNSSLYTNGQQNEVQFTILSDNDSTVYAGCQLGNFAYASEALSDADIAALGEYEPRGIFGTFAPPSIASDPNPANEETDVPRDVVLSWTPGSSVPAVNGHKVYFSDNFDDVSNGAAGAARGLTSDPEFDTADLPFILDYDTTYYWRIDEANNVTTWDQGEVWSFKVEPFAYPIDGQNITATASSSNAEDMGPGNTIDGFGLDVNDLHSTDIDTLWLSNAGGPQPTWIKYEFDKIYQLHEMWVWNYNMQFESVVGFGLRDVTIEYSTDGIGWDVLDGVPEFAQGTGSPDYVPNTTVNFDGVAAQYVRIAANSNWGSESQYGLSEVRFLYVPVRARKPNPDSGATGVGPDVVLSFRAGREAASHNVYLSTDKQAVIDGTAPVTPISVASYDAGTLELGRTYYWRIDEVNLAEIPTTWQGDVWSFETPEYFVVDDFEAYNDLNPDDPESNRIFFTWKDGFEISSNGSQVGHDSYPIAEKDIVHGGGQSMPLYYYNNIGGVAYSEAEVDTSDLGIDPDWTKAGVKVLTLYFYGDPDNTAGAAEQLYVKLNGVEVPYDGDAGDIQAESWHEWNIELSSLDGVNLQNVTKIIIGIRNVGASGIVYIDNIRLYPSRCAPDILKPAADLNNDCVVDYADLQMLTNNWLVSTFQISPADPGAGNLIGNWKLDEGTGLIAQDSSGRGNHGTLYDGPTWTAGQPGFGSAVSFDGLDDYVYCAERSGSGPGTYPAVLMPSTFTVSCWVKLDNFAYFTGLVCNGEDTGSDECGFFLYNWGWEGENGQDFGLSIRTEAGEMVYVETPNIYETDTWYHVAATYDGTNVSVYVDGALAAGPTDVGGPMQWISEDGGNYPDRFTIGAYIDFDEENFLDGAIDEVRYYNKALSHGQVGWLAGKTTSYIQPIHMLLTPPEPGINTYDGDAIAVIDLKDFAVLADLWLDEQLWP